MDPEPSTPTTDAPGGVPSWARFRLLYALWSNAADWQTRGSIARLALNQAARRIRSKLAPK